MPLASLWRDCTAHGYDGRPISWVNHFLSALMTFILGIAHLLSSAADQKCFQQLYQSCYRGCYPSKRMSQHVDDAVLKVLVTIHPRYFSSQVNLSIQCLIIYQTLSQNFGLDADWYARDSFVYCLYFCAPLSPSPTTQGTPADGSSCLQFSAPV
jgi:hypothetical protein